MDEMKTEKNENESKEEVKEKSKDELNENRSEATTNEAAMHLDVKQSNENTNNAQNSNVGNEDVKVFQPQHSNWNSTKSEPSTSQLVVEDKTSLPTFRFMKLKWQLCICPKNYPQSYLDKNQMFALKGEILRLILTPEAYHVRPRFFGTKFVKGCLILVCGDLSTVSWVKSLPRKIGLRVGVPLKTVDKSPEERAFVAVGHFPNSVFEPVETIMRYLEIQNEGISFSKWKILDRNPEKKAVRLTFSIDCASAELLKTKGPNLNYKLGKARFLLQNRRGYKFMEEDSQCEDDEDDDEEMFWMDDRKPECVDGFGKWGSEQGFMCHQGGFAEDSQYSARLAAVAKMSKNRLISGMTSRERFLYRKNAKRRKKRKNKELKAAAAQLSEFFPQNSNQLNPQN